MVVALGVVLATGLSVQTAYAQDTAAYANEVLNLVNKERQAAGLAPLTRAVELDRAAQKFAQYMGEAGFFSHNGPDGSTPSSRIKAEGYNGTTWGENIAAGQKDPQAVMNAWMNSSGHRANILHSAFKEIGIGVAVVPGSPMRIYWVQDFGARKTIPPGSQPSPTPTPSPTPAVPTLNSINPIKGKVGATIALQGTNFGTSGKVWFAPNTEGTVQSWGDTKISVKVPTGATDGLVKVQNSAGTSNGIAFDVDLEQPTPAPQPTPQPTPTPAPGTGPTQPTARPRMTAVSPRQGKSGVLVTIKGKNFGTATGRLLFGTTGSASIQSWTDTEIKVILTGTPGRRYLLPLTAAGRPSTNMALFAITP
jgi:hypothetical protein